MKNKRPLIGITASTRKSRLAWFFDWLAVWRAGGKPVKITTEDLPDPKALDGLVIGGGDDLNAELYGGHISPDVRIDPDRDELELGLLEEFVPLNRPILGICRGSQMINVYFGGTLHEEAFQAYPGARKMRTVLPRKNVELESGSYLRKLLGVSWCRVNSLHHQSVKRLGDGLRLAGRDRYGLVQAIEKPRYPMLLGVQWHPEFLILNRPQQKLFKELVHQAAA